MPSKCIWMAFHFRLAGNGRIPEYDARDRKSRSELEGSVKRANDYAKEYGASKRASRGQTAEEYVAAHDNPEDRRILALLGEISNRRREHELWRWFTKDMETASPQQKDDLEIALNAFKGMSVTVYQDLSKRLLAAEAMKKTAGEIKAANEAHPLEPYVPGDAKAGNLVIMFMYIGTGDCIIIKTPKGKTIVVDCGQRKQPPDRTKYAKEISDRLSCEMFLGKQKNLYALILTHPDQDHYKEAKKIIGNKNISVRHLFFAMGKNYYVENDTYTWMDTATIINEVVINDVETKVYNNYKKGPAGYYEMGTHSIQILGKKVGNDGWDEDKCKIYLLAANLPKYTTLDGEDTNAASIVTLIEAYGRKILLCGDATLSTEEFLLRRHKDLLANVDLAQMEHHGSGTEHAGTEYVKKINPIIAVASSGPHEGDLNPRWATIKRYADPAETGIEKDKHRLSKTLDEHEIKYSDGIMWTNKQSNDWKNNYAKHGVFTTESNGDLCFMIDKDGNMIREFIKAKKRHTYTIAPDRAVAHKEEALKDTT